MQEPWTTIIVSLGATGASILVALFVMWKTNKYNRKLQIRSEKVASCNDIKLLMAEYCVVVHRLYSAMENYRDLEMWDDDGSLEYIEKKRQSENDVFELREQANILIYKIDTISEDINIVDVLLDRMEQLKKVENYVYDVEYDREKMIELTKTFRKKFTTEIDKYINTL